ncbi:MAG: hypothetical protein IJF13_08540 [Clostridia bacterium]|nr:hypothetical protein [Clostridia bacterium]
MSIELLNLLLWSPFFLVAFIAGLVYIISGARRGVGHALVSLGATVASVIFSVIFARLLSALLSAPISKLLPIEELMIDEGFPPSLVTGITTGLVQMLLAYILLFLLLIIFTAVLRHVARKLYQKSKKKAFEKKFLLQAEQTPGAGQQIRVSRGYPAGLRILGMLVGVVSAFVFSVVLLLPVYGTLAAYVPAAETFARISEASESDPEPFMPASDSDTVLRSPVYHESNEPTATEILKCITSHPIVKVSGSAPFAVVYNSLSYVSVNGHTVNPPKIADVADNVAETFYRLSVTTPDSPDFVPLCKDVVAVIREEVINSDWCYGIFSEVMTALKNDPEAADGLEILMPIADISRKEFTETGNTLLDFLSLALEKDIVSILSEENEEKLFSSGILKDLGKTLNSTDTIVSLKANYISTIFTDFFSRFMSESDINDFLKTYPITKLTDPEQYEKEAAVILAGTDNILMLFEQLPYFGSDAARYLMSKIDFEAVMQDKYPDALPDEIPDDFPYDLPDEIPEY